MITNLISNHPGFSENEIRIWTDFYEKISPEKQNRLIEFLKINLAQLPYDIRKELNKEQEGLYEKIEANYIEALKFLTNTEEILQFDAKITQAEATIDTLDLDSENIKKLSNLIENEDDATKVLAALGADGIEAIEENLVENFLGEKVKYSFEEVIDLLMNLIHAKNVIAKENLNFMTKTIEIHRRALARSEEQQKSKTERANQIFERLIQD
jgi:hypothetical protein